MRIPNTAEFLAFFLTTGQLTGLSNQRKIDTTFYDQYEADARRFPFHTAGTDLKALPVAEPPCDQLYTISKEETCSNIALRYRVST